MQALQRGMTLGGRSRTERPARLNAVRLERGVQIQQRQRQRQASHTMRRQPHLRRQPRRQTSQQGQ